MTWLSAALALLKLAGYILDIVREKQQMDAGADRAIAEASASILAKTAAGKEIMAQVMAMTAEQVDAALKELEPK